MPLSHTMSLLFFTPVGMKLSPELGQAPACTRWCQQLHSSSESCSFHRSQWMGEEEGRI